jgi:mycothiol synthase
MPLTHRAYQGADDLRLMQDAIAHWQTLTAMPVGCHTGDIPHRIYNSGRGRYPLDEFIRLWFDGDTLVGFVMCVPLRQLFEHYGHPDYLHTVPEMLAWAVDTVRTYADAHEATDKPILTDVFAPHDPRQPHFEALGFVNKGTYGIVRKRSLTDDLPQKPLPEGYIMRGSTLDDAEQLATVHASAFDSEWTSELYRDEVMLKPGYTAEYERIVVAPDGMVVGFCLMWMDERNKIALFEPVGVHKDYQGKGIGRAMMCEVMRWLRDEQGMDFATIGADAKNTASNHLYESLGFEYWFEILDYQLPPQTV